jgi:hypothetical protein
MLTTNRCEIISNQPNQIIIILPGGNMATKLGEILVEAGVMTPAQLGEALNSQVVFGGRLGTNLIEMGFLEENELAGFLSRKLGLPCVSPEQLMSVTPAIIRLVPKELAEKYQIVPLALDKKRLTLAMLDPSDLPLMDEISFVTGYFIIPMISPELRMVMALEKHYGIKPDKRFVQAAEKIMERQSLRKQIRSDANARRETEPATPPPVEGKETIIDACDEFVTPREPAAAEPSPVSVEPVAVEPVAVEPVAVEPVAVEPVAVEPVAVEPVAVEPVAVEPVAVEPVAVEPVAVEPVAFKPVGVEPESAEPARTAQVQDESARFPAESLAEGLTEAKDRQEIADLLVSHLSREFNRVALFMIKGTVAEGWKGVRNNRPIAGMKDLQISLGSPSVIKIVTEGKSFYLGAIPDTSANSLMISALGGNTPSSALLVPMMLMGRVVAIVYVEGGREPLANRLAELQKLVGKVAMAFEILILKNKILMT